MLVLTRRLSIPADRCTLLSRGCRFHHWDTGRAADKPCHSNRSHRAPHSAIPGTRQCRHRPPWWGYTLPRFGTDTGCCSEVPSSRSHSLQAQKERISEYSPNIVTSRQTNYKKYKILIHIPLYIIHFCLHKISHFLCKCVFHVISYDVLIFPSTLAVLLSANPTQVYTSKQNVWHFMPQRSRAQLSPENY